jgi:hypothetical protein
LLSAPGVPIELVKNYKLREAPGNAPTTGPVASLSQVALTKRLGCSDKAIEKHRKLGSKESFAKWSYDRDPNSIA